MKKVSLKTVKNRALRDKKFLNALLKNPLKAMKGAEWQLSVAEMRKLRNIIKWAKFLKRMRNVERLPMMVPYRPLNCWPPIP